MQAGRQRGALPLIRKFNEHSERLLNAAEYAIPGTHFDMFPHISQRSTKQATACQRGAHVTCPVSVYRSLNHFVQDPYSELVLEDLQGGDDLSGIPLEMKDRDRYFNGGPGMSQRTEDVSYYLLAMSPCPR